MKKCVLTLLTGISVLMISCKKDIPDMNNQATLASRESCEPFPFGMLALNNGSMVINGINDFEGNLGYSKNVISLSNGNINNFSGAAVKHSLVNNFQTFSTFQPLFGMFSGSETDASLDESNMHATNLSNLYRGLLPSFSFGTLTRSINISSDPGSASGNTVVNITSMDYSNDMMTLTGTEGGDDGFIINVRANMSFVNSEIMLVNVRPERVLFNFPNNAMISICNPRAKFKGTILAPKGTVVYLNPGLFEGSIIAKNIAAATAAQGLIPGSTNAGASTFSTNFIHRTYCNGFQWE